MPLDKEKLESLRIDREQEDLHGGGTARWWIAGIFVAVVLAVAAWFFLRDATPLVTTVTVEAPAAGNSSAVLNASGYVVARRLATVSSKVTGKIIDVLIEEGATVAEGDVLARLDDSTVRARLAVAESQLSAANTRVREVRVRLDEARRNLGRTRTLRERKLVSESALDTAEADVAALEARLRSSRSEVEVAGKSVALAEQDLDDLTIRAPFSGVVVAKNAQPGEMISPISAGGGFTRTGIGTIVDMDSREIEVDVNESYINRVYSGQPVEAVLDAYPDWSIPAEVINIVPTADRSRATVKVRIAFEELDERILPDMGVKVRFLESQQEAGDGDGPQAVALVPPNSVFSEDQRDYVWVVRNEVLEKRAIRLGREVGGRREVIAGLAPGQRVIEQPSAGLRDGLRVRVE